MKKTLLITVFHLLLVCCSNKESIDDSAHAFFDARKLGELKNKNMQEISGIVSSINNPGFLWAHNDSGNDAEIFLCDENLDLKLTCKLAGIDNRDWEDITIGPGPDSTKNYIYVADIGDNDAQYQYKYIYRFEEPVWRRSNNKKITISKVDRIVFQLPDEKKDTETLMIDPSSMNLYVISKRENPVYLYELSYPYATGDTLTARKVMELPFDKIVGGDISPDGKEILLKNYNHIFYWSAPSPQPITELLKRSPTEVPYEKEPQGESIAWARDGSGFFTLSEENKNKKSYLYFYKRK